MSEEINNGSASDVDTTQTTTEADSKPSIHDMKGSSIKGVNNEAQDKEKTDINKSEIYARALAEAKAELKAQDEAELKMIKERAKADAIQEAKQEKIIAEAKAEAKAEALAEAEKKYQEDKSPNNTDESMENRRSASSPDIDDKDDSEETLGIVANNDESYILEEGATSIESINEILTNNLNHPDNPRVQEDMDLIKYLTDKQTRYIKRNQIYAKSKIDRNNL